MPKKSHEQENTAKRLGQLGESVVQSFLLEHALFCYKTCEGHPADLIVEFGNNSLYKVQVKARNRSEEQSKYTFACESHRSKADSHKEYHYDIIAFVFLPSKRIIFRANSSNQNYYVFYDKHLTESIELQSLDEALKALSSYPRRIPLLDEADK